MSLGPGKYDDTCDWVRVKHSARMTILVIIEGDRGNGVSVKTVLSSGELARVHEIDLKVAAILRTVADGIERDSPPF